MGLFDRLFGKKKDPAPVEKETPHDDSGIAPCLAAALAHYHNGEYHSALTQALPHVATDDASVRVDAKRLCALSLSALDRYPEAFEYWLSLFEDESSAHNALQLAASSVMAGAFDRGEAWLLKFDQLNEQNHEMSAASARTNLISAYTQAGHSVRAIPHLEWLKQAYAALTITDPTFLQLRGLPFFSVFLERSLPILQSALTDAELRTWYGELRGKLDEDGQAAVETWIAALA